MAKGNYRGGSVLIGLGVISKAKGRSGGIGDASGSAAREQQRKVKRRQDQKLAEQINENQRELRKLGKHWAEEKDRRHYEHLVLDQRAKSSPLAAALLEALDPKNKD